MNIITIIPNKLFLSNMTVANCDNLLSQKKITHILNVSQYKTDSEIKQNYKCLQLNITDEEDVQITDIFEEAHNFINSGEAVLVHCAAGISRSPTVIISYLMCYKNMNLKEAYFFVKSARNCITPNKGFLKQLLKYEKILRPEDDPSITYIDLMAEQILTRCDGRYTREEIYDILSQSNSF